MARHRGAYSLYPRNFGGKTYYYYRTYTPTGQRTSGVSTGCTSRSAARKYCDELLAAGMLYTGVSMTFRQYAEHFFDEGSIWYEDRKIQGYIARSTVELYQRRMKRYMIPLLGTLRLCDINSTVIKDFRNKCKANKGKELSNGFINKIMSQLHTVIASAVNDGYIMRDPFYGMKFLNEPKVRRDAFTLSELQGVISASYVPDVWYTIALACTGMRPSEMLAVRLSDVKSAGGLKYIELDKQFFRGEICPVKTRNSRVIPISEKLYGFLETIAQNESTSLFRATYARYVADFKAAVVASGIPEDERARRLLTLHALRHFFTTNTKASGVPSIKVEAVTGHKVEKGTGAVYTNFAVADLTEIAQWQDLTLGLLLPAVQSTARPSYRGRRRSV